MPDMPKGYPKTPKPDVAPPAQTKLREIPKPVDLAGFREELRTLLAKYEIGRAYNTPAHLLVNYILVCLDTLDCTIVFRDHWFAHVNPEAHIGKRPEDRWKTVDGFLVDAGVA